MKRFRDTHYFVTEDGRIFNSKKGRFLKPWIQHFYYAIRIKNKCHRIHRMVAECYIENTLNLPWINHIDGNKLNNNVSNLEWCTPSQNLKHSYDIKLRRKMFKNTNSLGERNHNAKLNETDIKEIRTKYNQGFNFTQLKEEYKVSHNTISYIVKRKTWKHVE